MADTRHTTLIKGATTLSLAGLVFAASPAHEALAAIGPFDAKFRQDNPLMIPAGADRYSKPALVDIDADGDLDLFVGDENGTIYYFENIGSDTAADFEMRTGSDNPFWYANTDTSIDVPYLPYDMDYGHAAPAFADLDHDGDMDAFVGDGYGHINYFENIGTASAPQFTERTGSDAMAPFWYECGTNYYQNDWSQNSTPAFVDIDGDGDMDLFVGNRYGYTNFFENTGTRRSPVFTEADSGGGPFGYDVGYDAAPTFVDIDNDGDMDAFVGDGNGYLAFFRNVGTPQDPEFERQWGGEGHPLDGKDMGDNSAPVFADIDHDGDMDLFIGEAEGAVYAFKNTGTPEDAAFTELKGKASPTWGFDVVQMGTPAFVDIDGDGDMDAFVGEGEGHIYFMENTGDAKNPVFAEPADFDDPANPFYGVALEYSEASPAFVDIDGDGDMDAFVGSWYGPIAYFKNIGTATAPDLVQMPGENPLGDDIIEDWVMSKAPTFVDIDNDGDMDAFNYYGGFVFYQNFGTATAPDFTVPFPLAESEPVLDNPLDGLDIGGQYARLSFADMDGDGDMDLFVGTAEGAVHYFENTGSAEEPNFIERADENNPFAQYLLEAWLEDTAPAAVDIDGDGDIDLFVGEAYGRFLYLENQEIVEAPAALLPDTNTDTDSSCFIGSMSGRQAETGASFSILGTLKSLCTSLLALVR